MCKHVDKMTSTITIIVAFVSDFDIFLKFIFFIQILLKQDR